MASQPRVLDHLYCANVSIMFTELPYPQRFAAARAAGFAAVETWWPFDRPTPTSAEVDAVLEAVSRSGVRLQALNFYAGDMAAGERGVACRPERRHELEASVDILVRMAEETGCRLFNLLYGQLDDHRPAAVQHQAAVDAIAHCADPVAALGGTVLLEPLARGLNGAYPLHTPDDVVRTLDQLPGVDNVGLLFDLFHLGSNGIDLVQAASRYADLIRHVQVADAPGRGEPGSGELPITATLTALRAAGYAGAIGCEYKPSTPDTTDTLDWIPDAAEPD
jgi:hydroxypyruvate isomerase